MYSWLARTELRQLLSKYDPLRVHLKQSSDPIEMRFSDVARLVGGLPPSAYRLPAWWSNNANRHVQARAWLDVGRRVGHFDLQAQRLVFSAPESQIVAGNGGVSSRSQR